MKNDYSKIFFFTVLLLLLTSAVFAQRDTVLNQPNQSGTFVAPHSITLSPGFIGVAGFHAYIDPSVIPCVPLNTSLSNNQNYIATYIPRVAGVTNPADPNNTTCQVMATVQYFDGLGRPLQMVSVKGSPTFKDVVVPSVYDAFGREAVKYLPYTTSSGTPGSYQPNAFADQAAFYNPPGTSLSLLQLANGVTHISSPYAQTIFEPSPLNRVVEQGAPGDPWQPGNSHTIKSEYATNDAASITSGSGRWAKMYSVSLDANGRPSLVDGGSYGINQLSVMITKDENWKAADGKDGTTEEYIDKEGRAVLSRSFNTGGEVFSTYYVYNDLGTLSFVLPPVSEPDNGGITQSALDKVCYQYRYDERQRKVESKVPGKGADYIVYDKIDHVVATQDSMQRVNNRWAFVKYDTLERPLITGIWNNGGTAISRSALQAQINAMTSLWEQRDNATVSNKYYTNSAYPTSNITDYLTVNYYDDYNIPSLPSVYDQHNSYSPMTKSLLTVALTNVLGTNDLLWSIHYYDDNGRIVKTIAQHYLGGSFNLANYDETATTYDFTGAITATKRDHHAGSNPLLTIANTYDLDQTERKTKTWEQINNGPNVILSQIDYNEIGQIKAKHLHSTNSGSSFLQDVAFRYNERAWLVQDSSRLFMMQLKYNDGTTPQFNGNIANQYWGTGGNLSKNYTYSYDKLNRLMNGTSNENFTENNITYDKAGNLLTLSRIDPIAAVTKNLVYQYNGNQLTNVTGLSPNNYLYDGNGNATYDAHNEVTIAYNHLNLPANISGTKTISYTYDAEGHKLRRASANTTFGNSDYDNGIQYKNGTVAFVATDEGLARRNPVTNAYSYEYSLSDHLGNNRVSFDDSSSVARIIQKDDYYPYGLEFNRYVFGEKNKYLYNKKELQEELGQYDYGARFYDPTIGRFLVIDKYTEKNQGLSSYQYGALDPIKTIDINGDSTWTTTQDTKRGKDTYSVRTLHVTGKVLNNAMSTVSAGELAAGLNDELNSQSATSSYADKLTGGTVHVTYKIDAKFEGVSSMAQVGKSDHLVAIVNDVTGHGDPALGTGNAVGLAPLRGMIAYVEAGQGFANMVQTAFHEVGHNLGLDHPDPRNPDPNNPNTASNPMSYLGRSTTFGNAQVINMYLNSVGMALNQGGNRAYITNKQNTDADGFAVRNNSSTNTRPYLGDRRQGMVIPKPVTNPNQ